MRVFWEQISLEYMDILFLPCLLLAWNRYQQRFFQESVWWWILWVNSQGGSVQGFSRGRKRERFQQIYHFTFGKTGWCLLKYSGMWAQAKTQELSSLQGHVVSLAEISTDPAKIQLIQNWPQMSSMISVEFVWGPEQEEAWQLLKAELVRGPILTYPDPKE